jgi:hypothetical protein
MHGPSLINTSLQRGESTPRDKFPSPRDAGAGRGKARGSSHFFQCSLGLAAVQSLPVTPARNLSERVRRVLPHFQLRAKGTNQSSRSNRKNNERLQLSLTPRFSEVNQRREIKFPLPATQERGEGKREGFLPSFPTPLVSMNTPNIDTDPSALDTPTDVADRLIPLCDGSPGLRGTMPVEAREPSPRPSDGRGINGEGFRRRYLEQKLLEVSAVAIPADPHALALGLKCPSLSPKERAGVRGNLPSTLSLLSPACQLHCILPS